MDPKLVWTIVVIAAVLVMGGLWVAMEKQRRQRLRRRFGAEYEGVVREVGSVRRAEAALVARTKRVERTPESFRG